MTPSTFTYELPTEREPSVLREDGIESGFIGTRLRRGSQRPRPPTREEFNRFQEGCVEENTNTAAKPGFIDAGKLGCLNDQHSCVNFGESFLVPAAQF